jgi:hypothetical protein
MMWMRTFFMYMYVCVYMHIIHVHLCVSSVYCGMIRTIYI